MNPRSMTGFARARNVSGDREVTATVKGVNHRGLDIHVRMAPELDPFEPAIRAAVKRHVTRGHVQLQIKCVDNRAGAPAEVNQALLETYLQAFHRLAAVHGLHGEPDLNVAFQLPGMFGPADAEPDPDIESLLLATLDQALVAFNQFREREGAEIAADMRARNGALLRAARRMEELRTRATAEFQTRLNERLNELLNGVGVDPQRLAQEVAYLTDRTDISEELTRLKVHAVQLEDLLISSGEAGKKLEFLLQEMQRETNTILSKSTGIGETGLELSDLALSAKAEIEKIREQGLNLE